MMNGYGFGGFGTFGWIGMILNLVITIGLIVGIVLLVVWLVRRFNTGGQTSATYGQSNVQITLREILQRRYARGEITREQYELMKSDLG